MVSDNEKSYTAAPGVPGASPLGAANLLHETEQERREKVLPFNPEQTRKEYSTERRGLLQKIRSLMEGTRSIEDLSKTLQESERSASQAGIDMDKIPDFFKPMYGRLYNAVQNFDTRFDKQKQALETLLGSFEEAHRESYTTLWGHYLDREVGSEVGGSYGELKDLAEKRRQHAEALVQLEEQENKTKIIIDEYKKELTSATDPPKRDELHRDIQGYQADLPLYRSASRNISLSQKGLAKKIEAKKRAISKAEAGQNWLDDQIATIKEYIIDIEDTEESKDCTGYLTSLSVEVQRRMATLADMDAAVKKNLKQRQDATASLNETGIQRPRLSPSPAIPFLDAAKRSDKTLEEEREKARKYLKEPFKDIYNV